MDAQFQALYEELHGIIAARAGEYAGAAEDQCAVWEGKKPRSQPLLLHNPRPPSSKSWPSFTSRELHFDKDKMLIAGMCAMTTSAMGKMQAVPSIRANMGCSIFPSLFPGILPELFDDARMPWITKRLDKDTIAKLTYRDIKLTDEFKLGLEHMLYITEKIQGTGAYVFPLDLQDAIDVAHLVYGDDFFYDLIDDPPFINHLLDLSCKAIEIGIEECLKIIPGSDKVVAHYNMLAMPRSQGGIKFSEDTSTILGPHHIDEFTIPSLKRQLDFTGGGYVHYCGKNEHLMNSLLEIDKVRGINFGNPEMHDMEDVLRRTAAAGKVFYGRIPKKKDEDYDTFFSRLCSAATDSCGCIRLLLIMNASSTEEADEIREAWNRVNPNKRD